MDSKYEKVFDSMPIEIVHHLKELIKVTELPDDEKSFNRFMESWLAKRGEFDKTVEEWNYTKEKIFKKDNPSSCIAMTISGSLVSIGPLVDGRRNATYASIGVRTDVPSVNFSNDAELEEDVKLHQSIVFKKGPIKSTSIILEIAVMKSEIHKDKQILELSSANDFLLKRFIDINIDFLSKKYKKTDLIQRDDLFDRWIILTWFRLGGIEEYIYLARTKLLWLELFIDFYEHLTKEGFTDAKRDEIFLKVTNINFAEFIDIHKWINTDVEDFDIGVLSALEVIPSSEDFQEFKKTFFIEYKK